MRSDDLVPFLTPGGRPQIGMRQGTLLSWDPSTGNNSVLVAGQTFTGLPVLAAGSVAMAPGDIVTLQRYGNTYFIEGAIRNAGSGSLQTRSAQVRSDGVKESRSSMTYGDLATPGPILNDVFIGASRQCLVTMRASIEVGAGEGAEMCVQVSGASSIDPQDIAWGSAYFATADSGTQTFACSPTSTIMLSAADRLNQGLNDFKLQYRTATGGPAEFTYRSLTVIPF